MKEERKKILEMLAQKRITSEEAERLISALSGNSGKIASYLYLEIKKNNEDHAKFRMKFPIALIRAGIKILPKSKNLNMQMNTTDFDFSSINWDEVMKLINEGKMGDILNLEVTEKDSSVTTIRIFTE